MIQSNTLVQYLQAPIVPQPESVTSIAMQDIERINSLPNPPLTNLKVEDVYIRSCRLAGDRVDGHFGCFRTADLPKLLDMVQGAPALIGHNRNATATARFFGGSIQQHEGHSYIVPKFYWPRKVSYAEDLKLQIDTALMNEASIAFQFTQATCSICGQDIRECDHIPGQEYDAQQCHYFYDGISAILEGSFVYRGAEPGTGFLQREIMPPTHIIFDGRTYKLTREKDSYKSKTPGETIPKLA